jgi:hypothetical protein
MDRKKKILLIAFILILIAIGVAVYVITSPSEHLAHGPGKDIYGDTVIFNNRYQMDYTIGESSAAKVLTNLESYFLSKQEVETAPVKNLPPSNKPENYYSATIDEKSVKKDTSQEFAFTYNFGLSDGRSYIVTVKTDTSFGTEYIITAIKRDDLSGHGIIYINKTDKINISDMPLAWASGKTGLSDPKIIYLELSA